MSFQCVIVTPEQPLLDEPARQAIVPAHDGLVGILTGRAPLLVQLGLGRLQIDLASGDQREFLVDGGVAQMKDNRLTILTSAAWPTSLISSDLARAEYDEAAAITPNNPAEAHARDHRMRRAKLKQDLARG